jgi:hypothetical protein
MTGREKIEAALSPAGTPEFAVVLCYEGIYHRDHWAELTDCPWWYTYETDTQRQLAWRRDVIARTGQDWFELPIGVSRQIQEDRRIEAEGERAFQIDRRTGRRDELVRPQVGGWEAFARMSAGPLKPQSPAEIEAALSVPEDFDAAALLADGRGDLPAAMLQEFGRDLMPVAHLASPLWCCHRLWDFEELMVKVATAPELVEQAGRRYLALDKQRLEFVAAAGAGVIWIEECFTDSISPATFARLNLPLVRELVEHIRKLGMKSIYYYCGNPADRWEHLLAAGADALALEEGKKGFGIDIGEVAARLAGRSALLGNLDAIGLLAGTNEAALEQEIRRQLAAGRSNGGRFILSLGSPVTPGTPVARVKQYCELGRRIGAS